MSDFCVNDDIRKPHLLPKNKNAIYRLKGLEFCSKMCKYEYKKELEKQEKGVENND